MIEGQSKKARLYRDYAHVIEEQKIEPTSSQKAKPNLFLFDTNIYAKGYESEWEAKLRVEKALNNSKEFKRLITHGKHFDISLFVSMRLPLALKPMFRAQFDGLFIISDLSSVILKDHDLLNWLGIDRKGNNILMDLVSVLKPRQILYIDFYSNEKYTPRYGYYEITHRLQDIPKPIFCSEAVKTWADKYTKEV